MVLRAGMVIGSLAFACGHARGGTTATVVYNQPGNGVVYSNTASGPASADLPLYSQAIGLGSATSEAHVTTGSVKISGKAAGDADSTVVGQFSDTIVISAPGVTTGTVGQLTFFVDISGMLASAAGISESSWSLDGNVSAGASLLNLAGGSCQGPENASPGELGDPLASTYSRTVSFQFGVPLNLTVQLTGLALARSGTGAGQAEFDLAHSVYWAGIDFVTAGGNPVNNVTAQGTGIDWIAPAPVPEPASLPLAAAGLIALLRRPKR